MRIDFSDFSIKKVGAWLAHLPKRLWAMLSNNFWMKLLSLLLAILLWNYVVTGNKSITRTKVLNNVTGYVTSQSTLSTYGLALLTDPTDLVENFTVLLDVAQSEYSLAKTDNVRVTLDLSRVRTAGTQEVPLTATTSYGKVVSILPSSVTLTFETLDSRSIPVNVQFSGEQNGDYWCNVVRTNPSSITVSGAASVVRSISQARVYSDVTGAKAGYTRAEPYALLDIEGNEIGVNAMLTRSASSITVVTDVYPQREIPVTTEIDNVITGRVARGYAVTGVSVQPESVTVAADAELLDGISELMIEPVSAEGASQSFSARAKISQLSAFKNVSAEEVYVNITIEEINRNESLEESAS